MGKTLVHFIMFNTKKIYPSEKSKEKMQQLQVCALTGTHTHQHGRVCGNVITKTIITIEVKSSLVIFYEVNHMSTLKRNLIKKKSCIYDMRVCAGPSIINHLCPLNTKSAALSTKFRPVKSSNCILSISFIFHIDKSKS